MALQVLNFECSQTECRAHDGRSCVGTDVWRPPGRDQGPVAIALVGLQPATADCDTGRSASGYAGQLVKRVLRLVGLPDGYAFTSLVRCRPRDQDDRPLDPTATEVQWCRQHLARDLAVLQPRVLVVFGHEAARHLVPADQWPRLKYGRVSRIELAGVQYWMVLAVEPRHVAHNSVLLTGLRDSIDKARDMAVNGEQSIYCPDRWQVATDIRYCDTVDKVRACVDYLLDGTTADQACAFDVETRNLNVRHGNQLVMLQFCVEPEVTYVIPYCYRHGPFHDDDLAAVRAELQRLFTRVPNFRYWLTHNGGFEQLQVQQFILDGKTFRNRPMIDTMGLTFLLDENRVKTRKLTGQGLSLKDLSAEQLGRDAYEAVALKARAEGRLHELPPAQLLPYAADDAVNTQLLYRYCRATAKRQGYDDQMMLLAAELFGPTFRLFSKLRRNGVFVDLEHLRALVGPESPLLRRRTELADLLAASPLVQQANRTITRTETGGQVALYGQPWRFNHNRPVHRQALFFDTMALAPIATGKTGPAVDKKFFEAYGGDDGYDEVKWIQEDVSLKKLSSSYGSAVIEYVDPSCGNLDCMTDTRVRPEFGFTDTVTGRPNCHGPSVHQVPRADNWAKASIKSMYCAAQSYGAWRPGRPVERVLLQLDYMANEVRWWCLISGDPLLADALRRGKDARLLFRREPTPENLLAAELAGDIHRQTASLMFDVPVADVTKDLRQITKAIVFAIIYGGGPRLIAARIKKQDLDEVIGLIRKFQRSVPTANRWLREIEKSAERDLYVESPLGRRRRLLEFLTDDDGDQAGARRVARNAPIQGVASDACLVGAAGWMDWIEDNDRDWLVTNVVHDSCVTELPIDDLPEAIERAEHCFTIAMMKKLRALWGVRFICPLEVEFDVGVRWGEMRKLDRSTADLQAAMAWLRTGGVKDFKH